MDFIIYPSIIKLIKLHGLFTWRGCLTCQLLVMKFDNTFKLLPFLVLKRHELYTRKITSICNYFYFEIQIFFEFMWY